MKKKILVVGAGLAGATVARELAEANYAVDVIDKRSHIAGNAYDYTSDLGFRIHKYGPHLFHTDNQKVFDWLSRFTDWIPYKHKVKAILDDGSFVPLPPNRKTKEILGEKNIIDVLFRPYTKKMWGMELEELDPKVIQRIPIRNDDNEYYFPDDKFQYLPKDGYTAMVTSILEHKNISVRLATPFKKAFENHYHHIFNSMPIDEYFDFSEGDLPYRSIRFTNVNLPAPKIFPTAQTNFTHDGPYTRVTEWCHLPSHGQRSDWTTLTYEEPCDYRENHHERYYPVKDISGKNRALYKEYRDMVPDYMTFIGRCGQYVYLDMHQAIGSSLAISARFLKG